MPALGRSGPAYTSTVEQIASVFVRCIGLGNFFPTAFLGISFEVLWLRFNQRTYLRLDFVDCPIVDHGGRAWLVRMTFEVKEWVYSDGD